MNQKYRYDIAIFRCLAIFLVIGYHLQLPFFKAGFLGVDVFFVLSGYLMTQIISKELQQDKFSISRFYMRRINRIFPVFFLVLISVFLVIWALLGVKLYDYSRFASSSVLFISNFYYYLQIGYFQTGAELNFLLHTWSLSIEIQFYLLFPLLSSLVFRWSGKNWKATIAVLGVVALLSFLSIYFWRVGDGSFRFFMFHTRLWEFLVGSFAFAARARVIASLSLSFRQGLAALGLLIVLMFPFLWHQGFQEAWPSTITLLPVMATAMSLATFHSHSRWFQWPGVRFLADRSYGLYLWHWPLVVLAHYAGLFDYGVVKGGILVVSLLLASTSYVLLESRSKEFSTVAVVSVCAAIGLCCLSGTQVGWYDRLLSARDYRLFHFLYDYRRTSTAMQYGFQRSHLQYNEPVSQFNLTSLEFSPKEELNFLLVGDCHAGMFSTTIKRMAEEHGIQLLQATMDETFPTPGASSSFKGPDSLMRYLFNQFIPQQADRIDKVILMANYAGYSKRQLETYLLANKDYFFELGIPVVYIGQTDKYRIEYPVAEYLRQRYDIPQTRFLRPEPAHANEFMKASDLVEQYIDVFRCPECTHWSADRAYMYDQEHFSVFGTDQLRSALNSIFDNVDRPTDER